MTGIEERHLRALRALADHHVRFVLIGGVALQAYGYSAATKDVDVAVAVDAGNEQRVDTAMRALGAHSPAPGTRGTTFQTRVGKVELLRDTDGVGPYDAWMREARSMRLAEGLSVAVGSPSDVLLSKEAAGREKDAEALRRPAPSSSPIGTSWRPPCSVRCGCWAAAVTSPTWGCNADP